MGCGFLTSKIEITESTQRGKGMSSERSIIFLFPTLSGYDVKVFAVLTSVDMPLRAREVALRARISQIRTHHALSRLLDMDLVKNVKLSVKLPERFDVWGKRRRRTFFRKQNIKPGVMLWTANKDTILLRYRDVKEEFKFLSEWVRSLNREHRGEGQTQLQTDQIIPVQEQ
jgi:hypothetical protein